MRHIVVALAVVTLLAVTSAQAGPPADSPESAPAVAAPAPDGKPDAAPASATVDKAAATSVAAPTEKTEAPAPAAPAEKAAATPTPVPAVKAEAATSQATPAPAPTGKAEAASAPAAVPTEKGTTTPADTAQAAPTKVTPAATTALTPDITPEAAATLKEMCDFLKKQQVIAFTAEISLAHVYPNGQTIQLNRVVQVALKRPDKLYIRINGDEQNRLFVYDGKTLTMADLDKMVYAVLPAPATVDATLDLMSEKYGLSAPVSELLYTDPSVLLLRHVTVGDLVGNHLAGGKACRHLAFVQKNVDWQLWVEKGTQPLPRKLVITDKEVMGWPQYEVTFLAFDFKPRLPVGLFTFTPANDARKIAFLPLATGQDAGK